MIQEEKRPDKGERNVVEPLDAVRELAESEHAVDDDSEPWPENDKAVVIGALLADWD